MSLLRDKLADYLKHLGSRLREMESMPAAEAGPSRPQERLADAFEVAESGRTFNALSAAWLSMVEVPRSRLHGARTETLPRFFRRSGIYRQIADGQSPAPDEVLERLIHEVRRTECTVTYFALIDNLEISAAETPFGEFSLEYFDTAALKTALDFRNRAVFYPYTLTDFPRFPNHYFLTVSERRTAGLRGLLGRLQEDWSSRISGRPTRFPAAVEKGLRILALYDWIPVWQKEEGRKPIEKRIGWLGFDVPAVITVTDDLLAWPEALPPATEINMETVLDNEGNELGERPGQPAFVLDEQNTQGLAETLVELHGALSSLEANGEAEFLRTSADFLLKGLLSERLEQLLWHIIAIEAALGEQLPNESVTGVLRRRLGLILGDTAAERGRVSKAFSTLYSFRSGLVHGGHPRADVFRGHLAEARRLARAALVWSIRAFAHLAKKGSVTPALAPKRSDLLRLIDLVEDERLRLGAQISWLPSSFPRVPDWTR